MSLTVFTGGTILVDPLASDAAARSDAIAFRDGVVAALGAEAAALASHPDARVIDLAGGVLAPAPGDGHAHPLGIKGEALDGPAVAGDRQRFSGENATPDFSFNPASGIANSTVQPLSSSRLSLTVPSTAAAARRCGSATSFVQSGRPR